MGVRDPHKSLGMPAEGFKGHEATDGSLLGKGLWQKQEQKLCSRKEIMCMHHCSMQPSSIAWQNSGRIVKSSSQSRKKRGSSCTKKSEEIKHRTERCAEADGYRCVRCGKGSEYMKMRGKCTGPKVLSKSLEKWRTRHLGGHDLVRGMDRQGEVLA